MNSQEISMVQECTTSYIVTEHIDGTLTITIEVPLRFADLWITRLSDLRTSDKELKGDEL